MKRLLSALLAVCLLFSLSACRKKPKDPADNTTSNNIESPANTTPTEAEKALVAVSLPTVTKETLHSDGTVLFQYTYQNMSLVLHKPQVADKIILDFLNRVDSTTESANATLEQAKTAYGRNGSWTPYLYHITYSPMRIDHEVLSLFGNNVVFSGAGHPERTCVSANYDLLTGDILTLASIKQKDVTATQFSNLVLAGLAEIADNNYLYDNYKQTVQQRFAQDASQDEAWYFTQTGLCFYFAPYEIAPYSSGVVTVEIPYEKLKNIIHDDYLPSARSTAAGKIEITPFNKVNFNNFSHIAEIITENEGSMYMLHTDGNVQDIRLILSDKTANCTVFAAYNLVPGNGIMVQGNSETLKNLKITYRSGSNTVTMPVIK